MIHYKTKLNSRRLPNPQYISSIFQRRITSKSVSEAIILSIPSQVNVHVYSKMACSNRNPVLSATADRPNNLIVPTSLPNPRLLPQGQRSVGSFVKVSGPLGRFTLAVSSNLRVTYVEATSKELSNAKLELKPNTTDLRAAYKELFTIKAHLLNIFQGVTEGFMVKLNLVGLFYSVRIKKQLTSNDSKTVLHLNIGKSHPVSIEIPKDVLITYKQVNFIKTILIYGISFERVTKLASEIRALSPVERYKGKGFRLSDEFVVIKAKK